MDMLDIDGAWIFTPRIHTDRRGSFHEWFRDSEVCAATGRGFDVAQANCSVSRRGVIRGIHFSDVPPGQAKYVTCPSGAILDVIVDLRLSSPGFGRWTAVRLDEDCRQAVFLSEGLGHAFIDPDIAIAWSAGLTPLLSDKDAAAPTLAQARTAGLLPG